jgi:hypothetical protein
MSKKLRDITRAANGQKETNFMIRPMMYVAINESAAVTDLKSNSFVDFLH